MQEVVLKYLQSLETTRIARNWPLPYSEIYNIEKLLAFDWNLGVECDVHVELTRYVIGIR